MPLLKPVSNDMHHLSGRRKKIYAFVPQQTTDIELTSRSGTSTEHSIDVLPQYSNKIEIRRYLENLNKEKKVAFCISRFVLAHRG